MRKLVKLVLTGLLTACALSLALPALSGPIVVTPVARNLEVNGNIIPAAALVPYLSAVESAGAALSTQYTSVAVGNGTLAQGNITGANYVVFATSGATAFTTRTAAQMFTDTNYAFAGMSYVLRVYNTNGGTLTLTGGSGVTITGTATIATAVTRDYLVTFNSATTLTMQNIGSGVAN